MRYRWPWSLPLLIAGCQAAPDGAAQASYTGEQFYAPYTNLQVLASDVSWPELEEAMLNNLRGLGLRRTSGEGCLYCHIGSLETPMDGWDFASDAKPAKRKARVMMRMVKAINETYLASLEGRDSTTLVVTCHTCHKGRVNPSPISTVLDRSHAAGGMERVEQEYGSLRDLYYGRGVYDFRGALISFAVTLADRGDYEDAVRALNVNIEYEPDSPDAHRWLVRIVMERAVLAGTADDLRTLYDSLAAIERPDGALVWYTLRSVGVRLRNAGKLDAAASAFSLNERLYPEDHRVITDLGLTRLMLGDTAAAVAAARRALDLRPDYDNALELLDGLQIE